MQYLQDGPQGTGTTPIVCTIVAAPRGWLEGQGGPAATQAPWPTVSLLCDPTDVVGCLVSLK